MTPDLVVDEIARLQAEVDERQEQIRALRKLRSHPAVIPVRVYYRHGSRYEVADEHCVGEWHTLRIAHAANRMMAEDGSGSPVGVSVGSHLLDHDALNDRYPELWDW